MHTFTCSSVAGKIQEQLCSLLSDVCFTLQDFIFVLALDDGDDSSSNSNKKSNVMIVVLTSSQSHCESSPDPFD